MLLWDSAKLVALLAAASAGVPPSIDGAPSTSRPTPRTEQITSLEAKAKNTTLFCFVWMSSTANEYAMLPHVDHQLSQCDGRLYFTDTEAAEAPPGFGNITTHPEIVRVTVEEKRHRGEPDWLYHKNMAGLTPAWTHMIENNLIQSYDWVINVELDMFVMPNRVRMTIATYTDNLKKLGKPGAYGPLILGFGNAFAFNRAIVAQLTDQWATLKRVATDPPKAAGCPEYLRGLGQWPYCAQDVAYPLLGGSKSPLKPPPAVIGRTGCGQPFAIQDIKFQMGCWESNKSPAGNDANGRMENIRILAVMEGLKEFSQAKEHLKRYRGGEFATSAELFFLGRRVPVIHHVTMPEVHALAIKLLRDGDGL